jgi:hypothetical protein
VWVPKQDVAVVQGGLARVLQMSLVQQEVLRALAWMLQTWVLQLKVQSEPPKGEPVGRGKGGQARAVPVLQVPVGMLAGLAGALLVYQLVLVVGHATA